MMGRPSTYTEEVATAICDWLTDGKTLREFCRQPDTPTWRTVYNWIDKDPEFAARMEIARQRGADAIAEESLEIIDTLAEVVATKFGHSRDSAHVAWLRNRAYHRLQLLAKWHPTRYGERRVLAGDPDKPLVPAGQTLTPEAAVAIAQKLKDGV